MSQEAVIEHSFRATVEKLKYEPPHQMCSVFADV